MVPILTINICKNMLTMDNKTVDFQGYQNNYYDIHITQLLIIKLVQHNTIIKL